MAGSQEDDSPKIVWTFPLIRRFQGSGTVLNLGSRVLSKGALLNSGGGVLDVGETEEDSDDGLYSEGDEETQSLEEQIDALGSEDSTISESDVSDSGEEVSIQDGVFFPQRVEIDEGDSVTWVNEDDEMHKILSIEGSSFSSGEIDPGDEYTQEFNSSEVVIYIESIQGADEMSGAVIVGDAELQQDLPSEENIRRETFSESSSFEVRSMDTAADDKEDMEMGF